MTDIIDIQLRDAGTPVVVRNLEQVGTAAEKSAKGVDLLKSAMLALGAVLAIDKVMQWSDAWNSAAGLVRTSTKSFAEAAVVLERVFKAAQLTRVPLEEMTNLYTSTARAGKMLGASQEDIIKFSEGVGKSLAIQHISTNQARGALIQLGQAISMGTIRSQEYNSLLQNGQVILQTVARGIDSTGGSVAKLTNLVKGGHMTSKEFFDAFMKGSAGLDEQFSKTSFLFSQAFIVMGNSMAKYIGQLDQSLGTSTKLVTFIKWIGDNMPIAAGIVLGFGAAIATALSPFVVITFIGYMEALIAVISPLAGFAGIFIGIATALYTMRDAINLGLGDTTTLGDLMSSVWEDMSNKFLNLADFISSVFSQIVVAESIAFKKITGDTDKATQTMTDDWHDFFADTGSGWLGWLRGAAKVFDAIIGLLGGTVLFMKDAFLEGIDFIINQFKKAENAGREFATSFANKMIDASNTIRETVGLNPIAHINWAPIATEGAEKFRSLGDIWADSMDTAFKVTAENGLGSWLDDRIKLAQGLAASKPKAASVDLTTPLGVYEPPVDTKGAAKAAKELALLQASLDRVIGSINPVLGAQRKLNEAEDIFAASVAKGLIPQAEATKYLELMKFQLADALDPLKHMNDQLDQKAKELALNNREASIEEEMYSRTESLKRKGVVLTQEETTALRAKLVVEQELNRIAQARDSFKQDSGAEQMDQFRVNLEAIKQLLNNGGLAEGDKAGAVQKLLPWADISNTQEQMDAYVAAHARMYEQINQLEQQHVLSHQTAEMLKKQADVQFMNQRLAGQRSFFNSLAGLMSSSNSKLFAIGKAAAITTAIIDGYQAVQKAYAGSPYPWNIAAAAAQAVISASNVSAIMSQQPPGFRTGGAMIVGGSGGDDSQLVQLRASPGERISINTPTQARALENGAGGSSQPVVVKPKLAVFLDKDLFEDYLKSEEGEDVLTYQLSRLGFEPAHG